MEEYIVRVFEDRTEWRQGGKLHRLDGPAVEYANGSKEWWVEDKEYSEEGFLKRTKQKSGKTMSYKDQVKSDMTKVAYRQGARKATSISHAIILHAFRQQGFSESKLDVLLELLDSTPGKALLSYGLGKALERMMKENEVAQTMAEEFRVSGMDLGVEAGLDKLADKGLELAPAAMNLMSSIEKTIKDGLTLETLEEFKKVDESLPDEIRQELFNLDKRTRISNTNQDKLEDTDQTEFENQAEFETTYYNCTSSSQMR